MIPEDKLEAVTGAVREAFGVTEIEDVRMITKGQSGALVFRIIVRGAPFLLRLITRTADPTMGDHFNCMKIPWFTSPRHCAHCTVCRRFPSERTT